MLVSGARDDTVRLWDATDGTLLHTLEDLPGSVNVVAFSPDGALLAAASYDSVHVWRVPGE
jgi:WD40 repeat protein